MPKKEQDGFWDLPTVSKKTYSPPVHGHSTDTIPVTVEEVEENRQEPIPPRDPNQTPVNSRPLREADRPIRTSAYATSQGYQSRMKDSALGFTAEDLAKAESSFENDLAQGFVTSRPNDTVDERDGDGWLIQHITVRRWINEFSFYATFGRDALISHQKVGQPAKPVAYNSFVPQYAHMDNQQLAYYLWFRDNARSGNFLEADFAYVLLYIFEILNLPKQIPPETGMDQLCRLWAHYRKTYPKLDAYLCEWVPDYALIHGVTLPSVLEPFLSEIVRKAQFKEFFLDNMCPPGGTLSHRAMKILAEVLLETYSDYDYTLSRYYTGGNQAAYDKCIPEALTMALMQAYADGRGMFGTDRLYRLTRDTYGGAIIHTDNKRRIDVSFHSCIRSPDTRKFVTGIVKYAENRLRGKLKIKSKLSATDISPEDKAQVDNYFGPEDAPIPKKKEVVEEAYMKLYDAETTGFDFSAAKEIENASWINTERLTTEETKEAVPEATPMEETPKSVTVEPTSGKEALPDVSLAETTAVPDTIAAEGSTTDTLVRDAVLALLDGTYDAYCRTHGRFPGKMAEQINEIFLDVIGDILVEADGNRYSLIEDYREDAEAWSKMET